MRTDVLPYVGRVSNAYLLRGERPVLVDAGAPGEVDRLQAFLRAHRVAPGDLALLVLTHGHADHAGAARALSGEGVPVMVGAPDAGLLERGRVGDLPVTGPAGAVLRPFIARMRAETVTAPVQVSGPTSLEEYGVAATVVPVGGHTPGSCVVETTGGEVVVGDLLRAGLGLGRIRPRHPLRHYFAEDPPGVRRGLLRVLDPGPARLFVGHGGPGVDADEVRRRLDTIAPTT